MFIKNLSAGAMLNQNSNPEIKHEKPRDIFRVIFGELSVWSLLTRDLSVWLCGCGVGPMLVLPLALSLSQWPVDAFDTIVFLLVNQSNLCRGTH